MSKSRLYGLDLFRVISVLVVFFFHSRMHLNCEYGILDSFFSMGAIFMTGFFILMGFVISYTSSADVNVIPFYKKRFIGIIPAYWGIGLLFTIYTGIGYFLLAPDRLSEFFTTSIFLIPIEFLALQSSFSTLFAYSHNSGTWFVSCLVFCYLSFPLFKTIIQDLKQKSKVVLLVVLIIILLYAPLVQYVCNTADIYTNVLFRIIEFCIGMLLANIVISKKYKDILCNWMAFTVELIILIIGVSLAKIIGVPSDYMLYSWCSLPCFMLMIVTLSGIKPNNILKSKTLAYASQISYMYFFAQFFLWEPLKIVLKYCGLDDYNIIRIITSFIGCIIIAILLHKFM